LQHALTTAKNNGDDGEYVRIRTRMEQAVGRAANEAGQRDTTVLTGKQELQRRFGDDTIIAASWEWRDDENYWVDVVIQPADGGGALCFTERLEEFPSEECIANIALVV
jgi:hypothetical protein